MIRTLNLDGMFVPVALPEIEYTLTKFPGGEINIVLNNNINYSNIEKVVITHRINNSDNLMEVLNAKNALEMKGVTEFELIIPYVPYARQDLVCNDGESFSLKVFASIINAQNFRKVFCVDAHSAVTPALIDRCVNIDNYQYVLEAINDIGGDNLLHAIPDSGASKKAPKLEKWLSLDKTGPDEKIIPGVKFKGTVQCGKVRQTEDGKLLWFAVHATDLFKSDCLIVDDICDGGGTFMGLAEELKKKNAGNLYLYVTHGIFSKGLDELRKYFKGIYTTTSVYDISDVDNEDGFVKQFKIQI